jgi:hypothetical protein
MRFHSLPGQAERWEGLPNICQERKPVGGPISSVPLTFGLRASLDKPADRVASHVWDQQDPQSSALGSAQRTPTQVVGLRRTPLTTHREALA